MALVIDASVAIAWCLRDEATQASEDLLDLVTKGGAVVPALWQVEMANILTRAERAGRIESSEVDKLLNRFDSLGITTYTLMQRSSILRLVRQFRLTAHDAVYLELAQRLGAVLATLDNELRIAAEAAGVRCLP